MYIDRLEITDIRCFKGTQTVSFRRPDGSYPGWTVLAGPNGAGKTTALRLMVIAGILKFYNTSEHVVSLYLHALGQTVSLRDNHGGSSVLGVRSQPYLAGTPEPPPRYHERDFSAQLPFLCAYGARRNLGPMSAGERHEAENAFYARVSSLFTESASLVGGLEWLQRVHVRALEGRPGMEALKRDALRFLDDGLLPEGSRVVGLDSDGLWVERGGERQALQALSEGYQAVGALVTDLLRRLHEEYKDLRIEEREGQPCCPLPGVVLIDEVEAHLHPAWQQRIGFWLTRHFPAIQFIVTTHSPFVCQAASPGGLIRLMPPEEPPQFRPIVEPVFSAIVNGGVDDAAVSALFGLPHPHSDPAEALRREIAGLEWRLMEGRASEEERARYRALKDRLPDDLGEEADRQLRILYGKRLP